MGFHALGQPFCAQDLRSCPLSDGLKQAQLTDLAGVMAILSKIGCDIRTRYPEFCAQSRDCFPKANRAVQASGHSSERKIYVRRVEKTLPAPNTARLLVSRATRPSHET
jgi:hypothetical protein